MVEYRYNELDWHISNVFENPSFANDSTETLEANYTYAENDEEPDMFIHHLKVIVYEVKHDILTDRMKADFIQYADRWDKGEFQPNLIPDDIPIIQADIDFVRSKLFL